MAVRILLGDVREQLKTLPPESVHCVVTSPPYWGLRDYGVAGQMGLEPTMAEHLAVMVEVFQEVRRVLRNDGTLWINYGDCYASSPNGRSAAATKVAGTDNRTFRDKPFSTIGGKLKAKDLCMLPNRLAIALQEDGWWVRSEIVWGKPNPMPDSAGKYRPSTAHEKIFLLTKSAKAFYDHAAVAMPVSGNAHSRVRGRSTHGRHTLGDEVPSSERRPYKMPDGWNTGPGAHGSFHPQGREKGRPAGVVPKSAPESSNVRAKESFHASTTALVETRYLRNYEPAALPVWEIASRAFPEAHFATFPPELAERCIRAGCPEGGVVLDPFGGAGTTGLVADRLQRDAILIELNPEYAAIARRRIDGDAPLLVVAE